MTNGSHPPARKPATKRTKGSSAVKRSVAAKPVKPK